MEKHYQNIGQFQKIVVGPSKVVTFEFLAAL